MAKKNKIKGTKSDDDIQGTDGADRIDARHGDDIVHAGGGADKIKGGKGADFLFGEDGDDFIDGGKDDDFLDGGAGNDRLKGGQGDDELYGGLGDDTLNGGSGADTLFGGEGNGALFGDGSGSGSGSASGSGSFDDYLDGGVGDDLVVGGAGDDTVLGGAGNDVLYGDAGPGSGSGSHAGSGSAHASGGRKGKGSGSGSGSHAGSGSAHASGGRKGKGSGSGSGSHAGSGDGEGVTFNDYLDGGSGDDLVFGQQGDDTGYWYMQENLGATDAYDGGTGTDTLVFALTYGEAADAGVQADLAGFDAFLATHSDPNTDNGATYNFTSFATLDLTDWEGYSVELINTGPTANDDAGVTDEDTVLVVTDLSDSLLSNDTDPDHLDVLTVTGFDATSLFGAGVTVNADGTYSYDATSAAFLQALAVGETALDSFSYTISDLAGETSTATVTIEVIGVNDAPVITDGGDVAGAVQEDATLSVSGDLDATDVDNGAILTWSVDGGGAGAYGDLLVDANGTWTYNLRNGDANVQALAQGETHDEVFTVTVTDEHAATATETVTVTIQGTNDDPVITDGGDVAGAVQEDATLSVSGDLDATDVDNGAILTWSVDGGGAGAYGDLLVDANGTWTYNLRNGDANVQALAQGETHDEVFTVTVTDEHAATATETVNITVTGTNDAPTVEDINVYTNISPESGGLDGVPIPNPGDGTLINGLGGAAGFGENVVPVNDDGNSGFVDLSSVFGDGLNFFGTNFSGIYINTNGNISFGSPVGQFTPSQIGAGISTPIIAPYWADVDTRGGTATETLGGTSTGANRVWYDLDDTNGVLTVTWDDVGYYSSATNPVNAFQLKLFDRGNGDFDVVFRYADINWTAGSASGGSGGLGGTAARAGYSAGNGTDFFELPSSGNQAEMLDLENSEGNFDTGIWAFQVRDGGVSEITAGFDYAVADEAGATGTASVVVHSQEGTSVTGAATDDILISDTGDDFLTGNAGDDLFVFTNGHGNDTVTDFEAGEGSDDALDLSGVSTITDFADLLADHASDVGSDMVIDTGNGDSVTLIGVSVAELHQDDFLF